MRLWLMGLVAACGSGGGFPDARVIDAVPPASFSLDWEVRSDSGREITCDTVGANSVTVLPRNSAFEGVSPQVFSCPARSGTSSPIAPGAYDFDFELVGTAGIIATAPSQRGIGIASGDNVRLTPLTFSVVATGALSLTMSTRRAGGNCGAIVNGGGGITSTQLTLVHASSGACEPQELSISASARSGAPATTYMVDCTTPVAGPCIENDQTISATGVPSGAYMINILARQGSTVCWSNHDGIQVPPSGQTLSRTLNLGFADMTPGCM